MFPDASEGCQRGLVNAIGKQSRSFRQTLAAEILIAGGRLKVWRARSIWCRRWGSNPSASSPPGGFIHVGSSHGHDSAEGSNVEVIGAHPGSRLLIVTIERFGLDGFVRLPLLTREDAALLDIDIVGRLIAFG